MKMAPGTLLPGNVCLKISREGRYSNQIKTLKLVCLPPLK